MTGVSESRSWRRGGVRWLTNAKEHIWLIPLKTLQKNQDCDVICFHKTIFDLLYVQ